MDVRTNQIDKAEKEMVNRFSSLQCICSSQLNLKSEGIYNGASDVTRWSDHAIIDPKLHPMHNSLQHFCPMLHNLH